MVIINWIVMEYLEKVQTTWTIWSRYCNKNAKIQKDQMIKITRNGQKTYLTGENKDKGLGIFLQRVLKIIK
jgi:hypothetical protein